MLRRISVLLAAVVMAMVLTMGTALAHGGNRHTVCHVKRGDDVTLRNLTHSRANWHINNHAKDYRGACDDDDNNRRTNFRIPHRWPS